MKALTTLLCVFVLHFSDISEIRKLYTEASKTEQTANAFHERMQSVSDTDANKSLVAYKGASETMLSKYAPTIGKKSKHLKAGAALIDAAALADPGNIEIRMIRLSVQENVPKIAGYRKNINEDKAFIMANFSKSGAVREYVKNFAMRSKTFSDEDRKAFQ